MLIKALDWNRYHVPRAFLKADDNTLIVFEELGGSPLSVNFQTVTVGTVCAGVDEGDSLELECPESHPISKIEFANFGKTHGTCGNYELGPGDNEDFTSFLQSCVGKTSCSLATSVIGGDGTRLTVQVAC